MLEVPLGQLTLLIIDPDHARRNALVQQCRSVGPCAGVATLISAQRSIPHTMPQRTILAPELLQDPCSKDLILQLQSYGNDIATWAAPPGADLRLRRLHLPGNRDALSLAQACVEGLSPNSAPSVSSNDTDPDLILIGASTGGIDAIETVLTHFPIDCPPTVIVQHIRDGFIPNFVRRLDQVLRPHVVEGENHALLQRGSVYVAARGDCHLQVCRRGGLRLHHDFRGPIEGHCPSVDVLFHSAVALAQSDRVHAALLTGMGQDGAEGLCALRQGGAHTIAQDQQSSVVWGMPRVAWLKGGADLLLPLDQIGPSLLNEKQRVHSETVRGLL